ncbi:MAG: hypothetical protein NC336_05615 [Clostridium sp.]|nr:hypothetical protein [Clostridium sp.]
MKIYSKSLMAAAIIAAGLGGLTTSCSEDDTLEGANAIYIEMEPTEITLCLGDTVGFGARVTNESGHLINTPVTWSVDDENIARIVDDSLLVTVDGAQGKSTKLRATLKNGKYGIATVSVVNNIPQDIAVLDTAGNVMTSQKSYDILHDSVVFTVKPVELLCDYEPTYEISGEGLTPYEPQPLYVDKQAGTVAVHYGAARKAGEGQISVTIGSGTSAKTGTIQINMFPPIEGATFYGPDYAGMDYIGTRPPLHTLEQYYATTYSRIMDVNQVDTVRVAVNVQTGAFEDIEEAYKICKWKAISGNSVLVSALYNDYVDGSGFDAVLVVRSGISEGETEFQFTTPRDTLAATYTVYDYVNTFPVDEILCDSTEINLISGKFCIITTSVVPMSSYGYHKPVVTAADPEIVRVGEYEGNTIAITGLKAGDTYLTLTSNGKTLTIPVHVAEGIKSISITGGKRNLFVGEEAVWTVNVTTPTGAPNIYPLDWVSSDSCVAAKADPTDLSLGIVKGVTEGSAKIQVFGLDKRSDETGISVIANPDGTVFKGTLDDMGVYFEDGKLILGTDLPESDYKFSSLTLTFPAVSTSDIYSTFTPTPGSVISFNGNYDATVTGGSIAITENEDGMAVVNGQLILTIPGYGEAKVTFDNFTGWVWN